MPIYEYFCKDCGHEEETLQRVNDPLLTTCPACGGHYQKKISSPAFQFKGSGFYETDYKKSTHASKSASIEQSKPEARKEKESLPKIDTPKKSTPKTESLVS